MIRGTTQVISDSRKLPIEEDFYDHYEDKGCNVAPSCLECPLVECKHDNPYVYKRVKRQAQDLNIVYLVSGLNLPRWERAHVVANQLEMTERTVFRALQRVRQEFPEHSVEDHDADRCGCGPVLAVGALVGGGDR